MTHKFYITTDSFKEENSSIDELRELLGYLYVEVKNSKRHNGSSIFVCSDIYETFCWQRHHVSKIWNPNDSTFDNDLRFMILELLYEKSSQSECPSSNIKFEDDVENISSVGLLTLKKRGMLSNEHQIAKDAYSWYSYCYSFIKRVTMTKDSFLVCCRELFDELFILDRCNQSISSIYADFKNTILYHLNGLNQKLKSAQIDSTNRSDALLRLGQLANFPVTPSLEGNAARKRDFTFKVDGTDVCCEAHLKLCHSDKYPGDGRYYQNRIYFNEGMNGICDDKIIVGHIGEHL